MRVSNDRPYRGGALLVTVVAIGLAGVFASPARKPVVLHETGQVQVRLIAMDVNAIPPSAFGD